MNNRSETVTHTRNYVLSVCGAFGVGEIFLLTKAGENPLLKLSAVAFAIAIIIGVVHVGALYWCELYGKDKPEDDAKFMSAQVRGKFSLFVFISLLGLGLVSVLLHVLSV